MRLNPHGYFLDLEDLHVNNLLLRIQCEQGDTGVRRLVDISSYSAAELIQER